MRISFFTTLVMMTFTVQSQYVSQIIKAENEGKYYSTGTITDSHLYYQTYLRNEIFLWSMDLETKKKEKIIASYYDNQDDWEDSLPIKYIEPYQGKVFFAHTNNDYSSNEYGSYLWSTDGTKAGTTKVTPVKLNYEGKFGIFNNSLFAVNVDDYLVQLLGNTMVTHDIKLTSLDHICVFTEDDFIVQSRNNSADTFTLNRITGETITELYTYNSSYNDDAYFNQYEGGCLFTHTAGGERKIWFAPPTGESKLIELPDDLPFEQLAVLDNRIFITAQNNGVTGKELSRLSEDLLEFDQSIVLSDFSITEISSQGHLLAAVVKYPNSHRFSHSFYDVNLSPINSLDYYDNNLVNEKFQTDTEVISVLNHYYHDAIIQLIDETNIARVYSVRDHYISNIISHPDTSDFYLEMFDQQTAKANLYSLTEIPSLSKAVSGTWHEFDTPNQGLVIHKGTRHDGSDYIFATLFVMDEGDPLWLAGVSDFFLGQSLVSIPVYKYQGLQFFESNNTPNQELFGEITIELTDCNTIHFTINSDQYNNSQPLYRINDSTFDYLCGKVNTLDIEQVNKQSHVMEVVL